MQTKTCRPRADASPIRDRHAPKPDLPSDHKIDRLPGRGFPCADSRSPPPAEAAGNKAPPIIRDAEIETTIREFTDPVFAAAGLDINAVHVYLLGVDDINAFVAGGMNVFIYTGLLVRTQRPNQLVGVVAHETGHIAGGHLARVQEALRNATIEAIIGMVLGGVASAAGGGGGAGILVGPGAATQSMLQYSRTMEASADAAAMGFLDKTHQSSRGLLEFFGILQQMEHTFYGKQNPYLNNHPLTESRIANVQAHIAIRPIAMSPIPRPGSWPISAWSPSWSAISTRWTRC